MIRHLVSRPSLPIDYARRSSRSWFVRSRQRSRLFARQRKFEARATVLFIPSSVRLSAILLFAPCPSGRRLLSGRARVPPSVGGGEAWHDPSHTMPAQGDHRHAEARSTSRSGHEKQQNSRRRPGSAPSESHALPAGRPALPAQTAG
jgi:hypothetical protein